MTATALQPVQCLAAHLRFHEFMVYCQQTLQRLRQLGEAGRYCSSSPKAGGQVHIDFATVMCVPKKIGISANGPPPADHDAKYTCTSSRSQRMKSSGCACVSPSGQTTQ